GAPRLDGRPARGLLRVRARARRASAPQVAPSLLRRDLRAQRLGAVPAHEPRGALEVSARAEDEAQALDVGAVAEFVRTDAEEQLRDLAAGLHGGDPDAARHAQPVEAETLEMPGEGVAQRKIQASIEKEPDRPGVAERERGGAVADEIGPREGVEGPGAAEPR